MVGLPELIDKLEEEKKPKPKLIIKKKEAVNNRRAILGLKPIAELGAELVKSVYSKYGVIE